MKINSAICSLVCLGALAGAASLWADDHVVVEKSVTRMGNASTPRRSEFWIDKDKAYIFEANLITIYRHDLQKIWNILPARKRHLEESIQALGRPPAKAPGPERIQSVGFSYEPRFDWSLRDSGKTDEVDGRKCRILILEGEADYAREIREMCVSRDIPIDGKRHYVTLARPGLDPAIAALYDQNPDLSEGMILKMRMVSETGLGPTRISETRVVTMEATSPPEGIYEIPAGSQKVSSSQELFR